MRRALVPALVVSLVLAAGCGSSADNQGQTPGGGKGSTSTQGGGGNKGTETASSGKQLFTNTCGSCHTLKDAGTSGTFGPNLDQLKPNKQLVLHQIAHGGGGMPSQLLTGAKAEQVATYVSSVAGR
jgi:mono/diheme cytochrome c family protein